MALNKINTIDQGLQKFFFQKTPFREIKKAMTS